MCKQSCGCSCDHQCTCHRSYMDTICPEGFQGSGCILYNGDILKDLAGADYIYSNTSLNTVIKQLWTKILSGSGSSAELTQALADIATLKSQMTTVISNIGTLSNLTTTAKTNLVAAINEIDTDLTALSTKIGDLSTLNNTSGVTTQATTVVGAINDRQPVWKKSNTVTVGANQTAPFNNLDTAMAELKKYHFEGGRVIVSLEAGTYNILSNLNTFGQFNDNSANFSFFGSTGNPNDVIIQKTGDRVVWTALSNGIEFKDLTIKGGGTADVIAVDRHSTLGLFNVKVINTQSAQLLTGIIGITNNGSLYGENVEIINNGHVDNTGINSSTNGTITFNYSVAKTILSNLKYGFSLNGNTSLSITSNQDITISNVENGILSYNSKVNIQTSVGKKLIITGKAKGTGNGVQLYNSNAVINRASISAFNYGFVNQIAGGFDVYLDVSNVSIIGLCGINSIGRITDSVMTGDSGLFMSASNISIFNSTLTATVATTEAYKVAAGTRLVINGSNNTNANSNIPINSLQSDGSIIIA